MLRKINRARSVRKPGGKPRERGDQCVEQRSPGRVALLGAGFVLSLAVALAGRSPILLKNLASIQSPAPQVRLLLTPARGAGGTPRRAGQAVRVNLPLYPGAVLYRGNLSLPLIGGGSAAQDLAAAKVHYIAPAAIGAAESWYRRQMVLRGYRIAVTGRLSSGPKGLQTEGIVYSPAKNPRLQVQISFRGLGRRRTLVQYYAVEHPVAARGRTRPS